MTSFYFSYNKYYGSTKIRKESKYYQENIKLLQTHIIAVVSSFIQPSPIPVGPVISWSCMFSKADNQDYKPVSFLSTISQIGHE